MDEDIEIEETDIEGENENETTEAVESAPVDHTEDAPYIDGCTLVYTESFEYVCAEDLIKETYPEIAEVTAEELTDETVTVRIEENEADQEYKDQILTQLTEVKEQQGKLLQSTDSSAALEVYEDINGKLDEIYNYVSVGVVLYLVAWIVSIMNTYRRNIK